MRTIGVVLPVWQESRYLPLVLEQMALCPGPKIVLWQDQPLHWLAEDRGAPSGWNSKVKGVLAEFPTIEVIKMDHAPVRVPYGVDDTEYGGFSSLGELALSLLRERGVGAMAWIESDWLLTYAATEWMFTRMAIAPTTEKFWWADGHNYWRDFKHSEGQPNLSIGIGYDTDCKSLWENRCGDPRRVQLEGVTIYHPGWVLSEEEVFNKVHSWGHAPYYKARGFYVNEWLAKDDSRMGIWDVNFELPTEIITRMKHWNCLEEGWL